MKEGETSGRSSQVVLRPWQHLDLMGSFAVGMAFPDCLHLGRGDQALNASCCSDGRGLEVGGVHDLGPGDSFGPGEGLIWQLAATNTINS